MNDNNLQQLLLQTEVAPPKQAWERIAVVLDEIKEDSLLQQRILSAETDVPSFNWDAIEQRLDDFVYSKQLALAEVEVPLQTWDQISSQLDEAADKQIADKLKAVKENPPAKVWPAIETQLDVEQTGRVIPFRKKLAPAYRLAAAAMITGVLAWGAYRLFNTNKPAVATVAVNEPPGSEEKKEAPVAEIKTDDSKQPAVSASASRSTIKKRIKEALTTNYTIAYLEPVTHGSQANPGFQDAHHKNQRPVAEISGFSESQYLMVLNEEGNLVRVSKKLSNLQCAKDAAEFPVDAATALQSKNCDEQIRLWQQKIAASTAISPSAGYIDLNEILLATEK